MTISKKLYIGFTFVICLAVMVGAIGIAGMQRLKAAGLSMYEKQVIGLEYVGKAAVALKQVRLDCHQVAISGFYDDPKGANDAKKQFASNTEEFIYWMSESYDVATTDELIKFHNRITELFNDVYLPSAEEIIDASISDMPDHINKLHIKVMLAANVEVCDRIENLIIGLMDLNSALAKQTNGNNARVTQLFITAQYLLLIIAATAAAVAGFYITKSIAEPINEASGVLHEIARGDFDKRVKGDYKGVFELIKISVNDTAARLSSYLNEKMQAEQIAHESDLAKVRA